MKIEMDNTKLTDTTIKTGRRGRMKIMGIYRNGWLFDKSFYYENGGKMLKVSDSGTFKKLLDKIEFIKER